eukprot:scaffold5709_cov100-Cylindrotheca_fusiformis.AAC.2
MARFLRPGRGFHVCRGNTVKRVVASRRRLPSPPVVPLADNSSRDQWRISFRILLNVKCGSPVLVP